MISESFWEFWQRAIAAHQREDWAGCLAELDRLVAAVPTHVEGVRLRGDVWRRLGRLAEAEQAYAQAAALAPQCFEVQQEWGRVLWQQQRYAEAHDRFAAALALRPTDINVRADLGITLHLLGRAQEAVACLTAVVAQEPNRSDVWVVLAIAQGQLGQKEAAIAHFERAVALAPDNPQHWSNYGAFLAQNGEPQKALDCYEKALALNPNLATALSNQGVLLKELGRLEEGIAACRQAIALAPDLADAYSNLGMLLKEKGDLDGAIAACEQALALNPRSVSALNNLGNALQDKNELTRARRAYERAIALNPQNAKAYGNLANALQKEDEVEAAIAAYERALAVQPDYALALNNLGNAHLRLGNVAKAMECYERAIAADPNYPEARFHLGMVQLLTGNYTEGWAGYEYRWQMAEFVRQNGPLEFAVPRWDGKPGQRVLLVNEQGLGDRLQFVRYGALVQAAGSVPIYPCPQVFGSLLAGCPALTEILPEGSPLPPFDAYIPLLSLPLVLGPTQGIPASIPYLFAPDDPIVAVMAPHRRACNVGLVWATSLTHKTAGRRSIPLALLKSLIREHPEVRFFALQKDLAAEEEAVWQDLPELIDLRAHLTDFGATAAAIQTLDAVITVDTAVAHLAGALGAPVWVLLPFMPDWRWLLEREDSPWYPTARLFRQTQPGDWQPVVAAVQAALAARSFPPRRWGTTPDPAWVSQRQTQWQRQQEALAALQEALKAYENGEFAEAVRLGEQARTVATAAPELLNLLGVSYHKLGQSERGAALLAEAVALAPERSDFAANWGLVLDRLGRYEEAIAAFEQALARKPTPEVYNNLGNAWQKVGNLPEAAAAYRQAIALDAKPKHRFNLATALNGLGDVTGAIAELELAVQEDPRYQKALDLLATLRAATGDWQASVEGYCQAVAQDPDNPLLHLRLGNALAKGKEWAEAKTHLQQAIALKPDLVEAYRSLAGIALAEKDPETAIAHLRHALTLTPQCPDTRVNLGVALIQVERYDEARAVLHEALALRPGYPEAWINLGVAYNKEERYAEAIAVFQRAIAAKPEFIAAYLNLGLAQAMQEDLTGAIATFREIIRQQPDHPDAHMNVGLALLGLGEWPQGWAEYEWRHFIQEYNSRRHYLKQPLWDGKPHPGTLLIYTEQGLGDCIQFLRFLALVKPRVGRLVVEGNQNSLRALLKIVPEIDEVVCIGEELPPYDVHYPLMSLPFLLGTGHQTFGERVPYLPVPAAPPLPMGSVSGPKVGLVWTANLGNPTTGKKRTIPLALFQRLLAIPNVQFYGLQPSIAEAERPLVAAWGENWVDLGPQLSELTDTLAFLAQLDLVVTVDTMVAHLAGAIGKPVWVLLPPAPDWRWLLDREHTNWYPSLRLFRRGLTESWEPLLDRVQGALQEWAAQHRQQAEIRHYEQMQKTRPRDVGGLNNLATLYIATGQPERAVPLLREALRCQPDLAEAHLNLGTALLAAGKWEKAWPHYQRRWEVAAFREHNFLCPIEAPLWDGREDLTGKTLYVHAEQGYGDTLQFCRYLPKLAETGARLHLGCPPALAPLLRSLPVTIHTVGATVPPCDRRVYLADLPQILGIWPGESPYLVAPPHTLPQTGEESKEKQHWGLVARTHSHHPTAAQRSCGWGHLHRLCAAPQHHFWVLQTELQPWERELLAAYPNVTVVEPLPDFGETAAWIAALDGVITVDTAVAHLAGALGKPVWILLPHVADWRWGHNETTVWYATARLFRQPEPGDWESVVSRLALMLGVPGSTSRAQRWYQAGGERYQQGDGLGAARAWRWAALHDGDRTLRELWRNLGNLLGQQNRLEEAIFYLEQGLAAQPSDRDLQETLARAWYNLGNRHQEQEAWAASIRCYETALGYNPQAYKCHTNLGIAWSKQGDLDRSIDHYRQAIALHPQEANAHANLGHALQQQENSTAALQAYREALAVNPKAVEAHNGLASALRDKGDLEQALFHHQQALAAQPDYANARFNLAQTLLLAGRYREGWEAYEARFGSSQFQKWGWVEPDFPQPVWDGSDLWGKRIFVLAEQGVGDRLQFVRCLALLKAQGATVIHGCAPELHRLLQTCPWIDTLVLPEEPLPPFDTWISLLSLPHRLGLTLDNVPATVPYFQVPVPLAGPLPTQLQVGLVWASCSASPSAQRRSLPLPTLRPLLELSHCTFHSLQKELTREEEEGLAAQGVGNRQAELTDFYATAQILQTLDLVITVDTAIAHLAGALGKPVWILLSAAPDWRWLLDRSDSPWYPTARLFRQPRPGDWDSVVQAIAQALREPPPVPPALTLAQTLYAAGRQEEARAQIEPLVEQGRVAHWLGVLAFQEGKIDIALACLWRAIAQIPGDSGIAHALGGVLVRAGHPEAAVYWSWRSLGEAPDSVATWNNLGSAYAYLGEWAASRNAYQRAIALAPENAEARFALALMDLRAQKWSEGWAGYEIRWQQEKFRRENPALPDSLRWAGGDPTGLRLVVLTEQGLGDALQFLRFVPLLKQRGAHGVFCAASDPLLPLVATLPGVDGVIRSGETLPPFDRWVPLLSLPHALGLGADWPLPPYLQAPPLPPDFPLAIAKDLPTLGLVWASKREHETSGDRSIPLVQLLPLLRELSTTYRLVSLQKDIPPSDWAAYRRLCQENILLAAGPHLTDLGVTAALIAQMEGVISVDTAVAHLTGALDRPLHLLLSTPADWRWESAWYPRTHLYRQTRRGDWATPLAQLTAALRPRIVPPAPKPPFLGIAWPPGLHSGWGVFGTNLVLHLARKPHLRPFLLQIGGFAQPNPLHRLLLVPILQQWQAFQTHLQGDRPLALPFPVLHALGNDLATTSRERWQGTQNYGFLFFENTQISAEGLARARQYDRLLAGSTWNTEILARYGIHAPTVLQGIDPTLFHPAPKAGWFRDRFVIFAGGKLEFRKGQDMVVAAVREFRRRHPETLLVFAWNTHWPAFLLGLDRAGHVQGVPPTTANGQIDIGAWLVANGLPPDSFVDVGLMPNPLLATVYREADVALFPNRCEGGTNLVAMECMACGIPTILSANTGHRDLIDAAHCYPLTHQKPVAPHPHFPGTDGWGESDLEEILAMLEQVYGDRAEAQRKGEKAAQFMAQWTWERQIDRLWQQLQG
ncbi:MAG: tetratricopeptide repeat protein [Pseudanabaenaceae cyanobacterium]